MKYVDKAIEFGEVPDEISLCINISNCPFHCEGCHSPWLWEDSGTELTVDVFLEMIKKAVGISCICIMGGSEQEVYDLIIKAQEKLKEGYKWAWYTGQESINNTKLLSTLNYLKTGSWQKDLGPLSSPTTNQRFYRVVEGQLVDNTFRFRKSSLEL